MTFKWDAQHREFLSGQSMGILATGRADGSPQQSLVGYWATDDGQLLVIAKSNTAKWNNAKNQPRVCFTVVDGRRHLVVYGAAEQIERDPERANLASVMAMGLNGGTQDAETMAGYLDREGMGVLRITPEKAIFHD